MISITFAQEPSSLKGSNWKIHIGHPNVPFLEFRTKRNGEEALAILGREATRLLRQLNEVFRRVCHEGQALVFCMKPSELRAWNKNKAEVDELYWFIASHNRTLSTTIFRRLLQASFNLMALCQIVLNEPKVKFTGHSMAVTMLNDQARALYDEIERVWQNPPMAQVVPAEPPTRKKK